MQSPRRSSSEKNCKKERPCFSGTTLIVIVLGITVLNLLHNRYKQIHIRLFMSQDLA